MIDMQAHGDFQGCLRVAISQVNRGSASGDTNDTATGYFFAGECSEALGDRAGAIDYYTKKNAIEPLQSNQIDWFGDRIAALKRGGALRTASAIQSEAAGTMAAISSPDSTEDDESGSQTAPLGMMAGMMSRPTYGPRGRGSNYVAPSYVPSAAGSSPRPAVPSSRPAYRDATQCARMSRSNNPDVMNITNSCSGKITVWMGGEFRTVEAVSTAGYTTIARQITYACFNAPAEDICRR